MTLHLSSNLLQNMAKNNALDTIYVSLNYTTIYFSESSILFSNLKKILDKYIHPSIFYTSLIHRSGRWGAGAGVHPGHVASPLQGHTRQTTTDTRSLLRTILETPFNLTCMFLDGGRKPEYPERTHAYTGRTCKLYTERPQLGVEPDTLLL